jgi:hypothetical protein
MLNLYQTSTIIVLTALSTLMLPGCGGEKKEGDTQPARNEAKAGKEVPAPEPSSLRPSPYELLDALCRTVRMGKIWNYDPVKDESYLLPAEDRKRCAQMVAQILDDGASFRDSCGDYVPVWHQAIESGNAEVVAVMLDHGLELAPDGESLLHIALGLRSPDALELVQLLCKRGADIKTQGGATGVHLAVWAALSGGQGADFFILKILLDAGLDLNAQNEAGETCLDFTIRRMYGEDWSWQRCVKQNWVGLLGNEEGSKIFERKLEELRAMGARSSSELNTSSGTANGQ